MKGWGYNRQGAQNKRKKALQEELLSLEALEESCSLTMEQVTRKTVVLAEIFKINEEEEIYWQQRSHDKLLHEGDNNTGYFHRMANGRRRKNLIISMEDGNKIIEGDDNLLHHATTYYKNLFGPKNGNAFPLDPSLWTTNEKVDEEENAILV